ncbi:hypothetical protein BT63DRAFT_50220 [Microthyrium microscopicum]|uniref:Uncharacterized protein n=1 Tax=Microthyrium microscopicum TaxID=703497 RepID=A0A6A6U5B7_9PEZI|nr:hypothetical protein BT63DRAFT_50220 [Microthyrium microscopicum]
MTDSKDHATGNLEDTAGRPSLDDLRTFSYNRIKLTNNLKSQIYADMADESDMSSDSLPLHEGWQSSAYDGSHDNPSKAPVKQNIDDTSGVATPTEKGNPMEQLGLDKQKTATPLTATSTRQSIDSKDGGKDRPSTLRRFTTKIKRTMTNSDK